MDQIIGERENERNVIERIKKEYDIAILREGTENPVIFTSQDGMLELTPRVAAMRRNPPAAGARRFPCMADIDRVKMHMVSAGTQDGDPKLLSGALAYQNQIQAPLCFAETDNTEQMFDADLFERSGFQYIYDRPHYELNKEILSEDMLARAAAGETVCLDSQGSTLQAVGREDMLPLAHFVNARLCRQYGFFVIRSAAYYEGVQTKLQKSGGDLFQIMEGGVRKGCFAHTNIATDSIREVVFDKASDRARYLVRSEDRKPAVMARIVNMPEMLRHISGNGKITVAIRIEDPVIAENDGLFLWYIDSDGSRMERVGQPDADRYGDPSMRPEVTTTIGAFTAFIFDYIKLKQNAKFDSIYLAGPVWMNEIH